MTDAIPGHAPRNISKSYGHREVSGNEPWTLMNAIRKVELSRSNSRDDAEDSICAGSV